MANQPGTTPTSKNGTTTSSSRRTPSSRRPSSSTSKGSSTRSRQTSPGPTTAAASAAARSKKTAAGSRVSAGSAWLLWAVSAGVAALFLFASIVSFAGLYSIAGWLGLPYYLWWAFPLAVDLAIVTYKIAEVVLRYDPRKKTKVKKAVFGTLLFTGVSSLGNIVHVASINDPDPLKLWGGIVGAGLMPWAVYLAASVLTDLVVKPLRSSHIEQLEESERLVAEPVAAQRGAPEPPAQVESALDEAIEMQKQQESGPRALPRAADIRATVDLAAERKTRDEKKGFEGWPNV